MSDEPEEESGPPGPEAPVEGKGEFWEDPGPAFDPENVPEPAESVVEAGDDDVGWTPDGVAGFLRDVQAPAFNSLLNPLLGVSETDWSHREKRLAQISPAIAREWNRIPHIKALAGHTDRALIASYILLEYLPPRVFDVIEERKTRREAEQAEQAEPVRQPAAEPAPAAAPRTGLPPRRR